MEQSHTRATKGWVGEAVFALDRMVRKWHGIYEYSSHGRCIFRIHRSLAEHSMLLKDGTHIRRGDPIIKLHLWNEHMPYMGARGPSVAWGRHVAHDMNTSLQELAKYINDQADLKDVKAICADMCLGTNAKRNQLARIVGHFGFEAAGRGVGRAGPLERLSQNIMMFLLVLATNPSTLRGAILLRTHQRIFLSRNALMARYIDRQKPALPARRHGETPAWHAPHTPRPADAKARAVGPETA